VLLAALLGPLVAGAAEPVVILLSWDGVRPDYLERGEFPALARMRRDGASAERLIPVFPTNTFPNHVALATGAYVARHGIVGNSFRDRERGRFHYDNDASWLAAEPLWVAAERQGIRAAVYFWVGSETDWNGIGATHRMSPFDTNVPESQKVERIVAWLDLEGEKRPRLIMSWWHGSDHAGHLLGPDHPRVAEALEQQDRALARLLAALDERAAWPHTTLLIVSDHGMASVDTAVDLRAELRARGLAAAVVPGGGMAHVYVDEPAQRERVRAALDALEGVTAVEGEALPEGLRAFFPGRTGEVVALTAPPRTFRSSGERSGGFGAHGYDPARSDMGGILLALGRGVPPRANLGQPRSVDVAPTVARLLGIDPPRDCEGEPIRGIGDP
jgi:predicted AlkP superfamily pyrophosphatase or phosphodiesterase